MQIQIPTHFKELDTHAFETYFGGIDQELSKTIYTKTAEIFLTLLDQRLRTLDHYLDEQDAAQALVVAHLLRSSLLTLGGTQLANSFHQMEVSLGLNSVTRSVQILKAKRTDLDHFITELKQWVAVLSTSH